MKIFGLGLHRTGTSSLGACFHKMRYSQGHQLDAYQCALEIHDGKYGNVWKHVNTYQAFQDSPWSHPGLYEKLDVLFPGSKFILTTRDVDKWMDSFHRWILNKHPRLVKQNPYMTILEDVYGSNDMFGNTEQYKARYLAHNAAVIDYFKGRDDLLVVNWEAGDGWAELVPFLWTFPHLMKSRKRQALRHKPS